MTLEEAKLYLKVDIDDDDTLIESLITAAEVYIYGQTGKTEYKGDEIAKNELYNLAVKQMLDHWYNNRGVIVKGKEVFNIPKSVDAIIAHIAMCGDYT